MEEELIPRAKEHARRQGVSLSSLVEEALERMTERTGPGFVERWRGRFTLVDRDDPRYRALKEKYL